MTGRLRKEFDHLFALITCFLQQSSCSLWTCFAEKTAMASTNSLIRHTTLTSSSTVMPLGPYNASRLYESLTSLRELLAPSHIYIATWSGVFLLQAVLFDCSHISHFLQIILLLKFLDESPVIPSIVFTVQLTGLIFVDLLSIRVGQTVVNPSRPPDCHHQTSVRLRAVLIKHALILDSQRGNSTS